MLNTLVIADVFEGNGTIFITYNHPKTKYGMAIVYQPDEAFMKQCKLYSVELC